MNRTARKYFIIEVIFLLFICYIGAIISDMEYSYYEEKDIWKFTRALEYRMVFGTYNLVYYGIWYWLFLKRFIFRKQGLNIVISIVLFIILSHLYNKYIVNWSVSKLSFLSQELRTRALEDFNRSTLYYIISYTLNRILFTIIGFTFLVRSLQQDEEMKELKEQQLLSELNYLRAQLQPHFFFNTLNNIYSLALRGSADTAPMIARLSEMMRYILYKSNCEQVSLSQEIDFLHHYTEIERIRHGKKISIRFDVQGETMHRQIEPLLLLPFVENAFKHGLHEELNEGFVTIVLCIIGHELNLQVVNSKPQNGDRGAEGGLGLLNVKKRLGLLYPATHRLAIEEHGQTYEVNLTLELK